MYLIHAHLQGPPGASLPLETRSLVRSQTHDGDGVEHVTVHPDAVPHPVVGLYVRADSLAAAESRAARLCRLLLGCARFDGWSLPVVEAPLVAPFYASRWSDWGPAGPAVDGCGQGHFGPAENPSTPSDQQRK
ncbi:hypothetical protein SNOUR_02710 [Streptomyces noursei ATCC 11455]|uniref:hypothetical protein n=1 Tax=Streptomyces noursei TaxID=1971 RepID=UPI00081CE73C|nr:hypothetical protein SNOUR_02710 [Streptomyces noursei ATCC 11455]